jgi:predicted MPP superfamily phosphohydrolase
LAIRKLLAFSTFFILLLSARCRSEIPSGTVNDSINCPERAVIFISDIQTPMWFEKIFVKTHRNEEATKILLTAITRDSTVSSVFILGDVTAMSSLDFHWTMVDSFLNRLKLRHIPVYAVAGNHDYLLSSSGGEKNLMKRFPAFRRTGYTIRESSFAVVLLNSNFGELDESETQRQQEWYLRELQALEQDSTIKLVAVGCHHPPYSNSSIVGHSQRVRDLFVPPFLNSKKCRLFLSGHAHTFQYFKDTVAQKHFLVLGGGGGLLHTLKPEEPDAYHDQVPWNSAYRLFHYVQGKITKDGLKLLVMMLDENLDGPRVVYQVFIPFDSSEE